MRFLIKLSKHYKENRKKILPQKQRVSSSFLLAYTHFITKLCNFSFPFHFKGHNKTASIIPTFQHKILQFHNSLFHIRTSQQNSHQTKPHCKKATTHSIFSSCSAKSSSLKPNWSIKLLVICCNW